MLVGSSSVAYAESADVLFIVLSADVTDDAVPVPPQRNNTALTQNEVVERCVAGVDRRPSPLYLWLDTPLSPFRRKAEGLEPYHQGILPFLIHIQALNWTWS